MATVNSTTYAAQEAGKIALDAGVNHTRVLLASTEYEAASLSANVGINLFRLPKGAVIKEFIAAFDDLGTGTTLDIGDASDDDRYLAGIDTATAAGSKSGILPDGAGYVIGTNANDDVIIATNKGAAATGTIKVTCLYAI